LEHRSTPFQRLRPALHSIRAKEGPASIQLYWAVAKRQRNLARHNVPGKPVPKHVRPARDDGSPRRRSIPDFTAPIPFGAGFGCPFLNSQVLALLMVVFHDSHAFPHFFRFARPPAPRRPVTRPHSVIRSCFPGFLIKQVFSTLHVIKEQHRPPHPGSDQIANGLRPPTAQILAQICPLSNPPKAR